MLKLDTISSFLYYPVILSDAVCRTFHQLWQDVAQNIQTYRSYPRLIGGELVTSLLDSHISVVIIIVCVSSNFFRNYTTINVLLTSTFRPVNVQWSLLAGWRGEQTVPHVT